MLWSKRVHQCKNQCTTSASSWLGFGLRLVGHRGRTCFESSGICRLLLLLLLLFLPWQINFSSDQKLPNAAQNLVWPWMQFMQGGPRRQRRQTIKLFWLPFPHSLDPDLIRDWLLPLLSFNYICWSINSRKVLIIWNFNMISSRNNKHLQWSPPERITVESQWCLANFTYRSDHMCPASVTSASR